MSAPISARWTLLAYLALAFGNAAGLYFQDQNADAINESRRENVLRSCRETNERNVNTVARLNELRVAALKRVDAKERAGQLAAKAASEERQDLARGIRSSVLLINALVPTRDCEQLADQTVP